MKKKKNSYEVWESLFYTWMLRIIERLIYKAICSGVNETGSYSNITTSLLHIDMTVQKLYKKKLYSDTWCWVSKITSI